jgi:hypothetical protein
MSNYNTVLSPGELWLRNAAGVLDSANNSLSTVFIKYKDANANFYSELSSNNITRFDVFYDCIFVETRSGYIFEKIYIEDSTIKPFNYRNNFTQRARAAVDYWFDERKNRIHFTQIQTLTQTQSAFDFYLDIKTFDCYESSITTSSINQVHLAFLKSFNWSVSCYQLETPKITYNPDNKYYNVSFVFRNSSEEMSLASINLFEESNLKIKEINTYIPFAELDNNNSFNIEITSGPLYDILVSTNYNIILS